MRAGSITAPPRARPVADAPVGALVDGADEVAKAWLLELLAAAPLAAAGGVRVEHLAAEGPELCAAVARALADDDELARFAADGDLFGAAGRVGELAGAPDAGSAFAAVEALRRAVWESALGALSRPSAALVADLADRLGAVCAAITAAVLSAPVEPVAEPVAEPRIARVTDPTAPVGRIDRLADLARAAAEESMAATVEAAPPIMRPPLGGEPPPEASPRVTDGDPRRHLAARTEEFVADGRPF